MAVGQRAIIVMENVLLCMRRGKCVTDILEMTDDVVNEWICGLCCCRLRSSANMD